MNITNYPDINYGRKFKHLKVLNIIYFNSTFLSFDLKNYINTYYNMMYKDPYIKSYGTIIPRVVHK